MSFCSLYTSVALYVTIGRTIIQGHASRVVYISVTISDPICSSSRFWWGRVGDIPSVYLYHQEPLSVVCCWKMQFNVDIIHSLVDMVHPLVFLLSIFFISVYVLRSI
jgi:hypothetical protein